MTPSPRRVDKGAAPAGADPRAPGSCGVFRLGLRSAPDSGAPPTLEKSRTSGGNSDPRRTGAQRSAPGHHFHQEKVPTQAPAKPENEHSRVATLRSLDILDTAPEPRWPPGQTNWCRWRRRSRPTLRPPANHCAQAGCAGHGDTVGASHAGPVVPGRRRTHRIPRGDVRAQKRRHIFAHQIAAVLARPSATPVLQSIRVPTLVLCGRADSRSPLAQHRTDRRAGDRRTPGSRRQCRPCEHHGATRSCGAGLARLVAPGRRLIGIDHDLAFAAPVCSTSLRIASHID